MASRRKRTASNPWASFAGAIAFGLDCQEVILRRLPRLLRGDALAAREAQRMLAEKSTTGALAVWKASLAWSTGGETAATAAVAKTYRRAVRANKRRLRRR